MSAFDVLLESGGWGLAVALAGVVALVGSIATGVALLKGRRVAAWVPTALLSLPSLVGVAAVWTCDAAIRSGIAAGQGTLAEVGPTLATRVSVPFIGGVLTVLAAASLLVVCAVVGARGGPRRVPRAVGGGALVLLLGGVAAAGFALGESSLVGASWPVVLLVLGGLAAVAFLAGDGEGNGPEAAAMAGLCLAVAACAGEVAVRSWEALNIVLFLAMTGSGLEVWDLAGAVHRALVGWGVIALSSMVAVVGVGGLEEGSRRLRGAVGMVLLVIPAFLHARAETTGLFSALFSPRYEEISIELPTAIPVPTEHDLAPRGTAVPPAPSDLDTPAEVEPAPR